MHKAQADPQRGKAILQFFHFAYTQGGSMAASLNYVPLPAAVVWGVEQAWSTQIRDAKGEPIWK
jgi:phosphate transport system substrate-binding protein